MPSRPKSPSQQRYRNSEKGRHTQWVCLLKRVYGITEEIYNAMLLGQGNGCAICGSPISQSGSFRHHRLFVDHDHKTGKVRGLLCRGCNTGLGGFQDSTAFLTNAITYLTRRY